MPFIVDGFNFNPLESRDGIFLNGGQNENIFKAGEKEKIIKLFIYMMK